MQRPSCSTERTPLVPPTYSFESSVTRSYQKRLRTFQCIICVILLLFLSVMVLVTISYNLMTSDTSSPMETETNTNLTLADDLVPMLNMNWPLKNHPPPAWVAGSLSKEKLEAAIARGKEALKKRRMMEQILTPLEKDTPASRAQRAAYTSSRVKPWADDAYAVEEATRTLINESDPYIIANEGIGVGPKIDAVFQQPRYCIQDPVPCPPAKYRTQDGSCNNLEHPLLWGVANTPFRRAEVPWYGDGVSSPRTPRATAELPSARDVSITVHRPTYAHDSGFTVMLAVWGQFIDHDITATALSKGINNTAIKCCDKSQPPHPECYPVELDVEDPFYQDYNLTCMEFVRSAPALTCNYGPREQLNQATAFIDASTVYGSSETKTMDLRKGANGQLRMLKVGFRELLPPSTDPNDGCNTVAMNAQGRYCFESGDERANENLHLTTMHLIWARQHNRVAAELHRLNPSWSDTTLFEEARRIVGAQMQHITYAEFLPAILGADVMFALNLTLKEDGYSDAYDPTVDPSIANHFSAAAFRFAHTLLPGLIRNTDASTGTVNYIHLHQMLFNPYALYNKKGTKLAVSSAINTPVHSVDPHVTSELSEHLFERPIVLNETINGTITKPGPCGLDLVSLNIQRGRDHGIAPYRVWREHCGLSRPWNFSDLENIFDDLSYTRITQIYNHVEDIDLYTGALAENPRGRLLGPTFTCLIADQFLKLKVGDRFWYETSDPTVGFTLEQLKEIRKTTLAGVICANEVLLDRAQPKVMEALSATNPLIDCKELPQPSFDPWKESPSPDNPNKKGVK